MGNQCLRKEYASQIPQQELEPKEKRQQTYLEGSYKNKLNDNRNQLVKTRVERMRNYE